MDLDKKGNVGGKGEKGVTGERNERKPNAHVMYVVDKFAHV